MSIRNAEHLDAGQIFADLKQGIERPANGIGYTLWASVVFMVMVLLPVLYLGLIVLTGYGVYYHLVNHIGMLGVQVRGKGYLFVLLAYAAPAVVGAFITLFMLKPLLVRPPRQNERYTLDPQQEPVLQEFIQSVCKAVGAPQPSVIELTMDVNAAAAPRKGLFSLIRRDLRLVIGVPLVAGTTVQQLGGVLAHEFGHFSQSAGMILSNLIYRINMWFVRVVFERDAWDEWLISHSKSLDQRIAWVLHLARLGVWISRKALHGLMLVGWAVSGRFSQQMEFDADRYEMRLSGSQDFEEVQLLLSVLGTAHQMAIPSVREALTRRELVDDFPRMIVEQMKRLSPELIEQIKKRSLDERTRWFDTHPCSQDRIKSAREENAPGILHAALPASSLFRSFDQFCLSFTRYYFQTEVELDLEKYTMTTAEELLAAEQESSDRLQQAVAYTTTQIPLSRPIQWGQGILKPLVDPHELLPELERLRSEILRIRSKVLTDYETYNSNLNSVAAAGNALAMHQCNLATVKNMEGTSWQTLESTQKDLKARLSEQKEHIEALAEYEKLLGQRASLGLRVWYSTTTDPRREKLVSWIGCMRQIDEARAAVRTMQMSLGRQEFILEQFGQYLEDERVVRGIWDVHKELVEEAQKVFEMLRKIRHPFSESSLMISDTIDDKMAPTGNPIAIFHFSVAMREQLDAIQSKLILHLLSFAAEGEKYLGLEPLPAVPKPTESSDDE